MNDPIQYQVVQEKRFPWGCCIGGCLAMIAVILIGLGTAGYFGYRFYVSQINRYTSAEPVEIPSVEASKEEVEAVQKRFEDFKKALDTDQSPQPLVLTSKDINALINMNDELKGKVYVTIEEGEISARASIPADFVPGAEGRYFNGRISLKASLENGVLIVTLDDAEVNGEAIPAEYLTQFREENLAKDVYKDPEAAEFLRKFERLTIENDKLILTPAVSETKSQPVDEDANDETTTEPSSKDNP